MSKSAKELVATLVATGDYSPNQIAAMKAEIGPEYKKGSFYVRTGVEGGKSVGNVYMASDRLGTSKKRGKPCNLINLDTGRLSNFDSSKFELLGASIDSI